MKHTWTKRNRTIAVAFWSLVFALGLMTALFLLGQRTAAEHEYRSVDLAVFYDDLLAQSEAADVSLDQTLRRYRDAGATALFVKERNLATLAERFTLRQGQNLRLQGLPALDGVSYLEFTDPALARRVSDNLDLRGLRVDEFSAGDVTFVGTELKLANPWTLHEARRAELFAIGLGWPEEDMRLAETLGYNLQVQIWDWPDLRAEQIEPYLQQLDGFERISLVLFNSVDLFDESRSDVTRAALPALGQALTRRGWPVGQVEFYDQEGLALLAENMQERLVRLHTIPEAELSSLNRSQALDRFELAVKDRNMRALFVRAAVAPGPDALDANAQYVASLRARLIQNGFSAGPAGLLPNLYVAPGPLMLMALGLCAALALAGLLLGYPFWGTVLAGVGAIASAGLLGTGRIELAQKLLALGAACLLPAASLAVVLDTMRPARTSWQALAQTLMVTTGSATGAVLVAGMLRERAYMLGLDMFSGVKIAHLAPLALGALYLAWRVRHVDFTGMVRRALNRPITLKILILGGIVAATGALYVLRTGNTGGLVSGLEATMRQTLETLTGARPRTKEFLIGYPALLLGLRWRPRFGSGALLLAGLIGQASLINTFSHIHTPLAISALRSLYGLGLGLAVGLVLLRVIVWIGERGQEDKT